DDAGATKFHVIIDGRSHPQQSLLCNEMKVWQGPAILLYNNAKFKKPDFDSLMQIRVGGKQGDDTKIGKHGLGFNSCYHFTDVPSFISGDSIAFLDPQEKFLPKKQNYTQRGIKCPFPPPPNVFGGYSERDQLAPYIDIGGINYRSTFEGTIFRIPLRKQPSEISDRLFKIEEIVELFKDLKSTISSQCLFLRNIETIEIFHLPKDKNPSQMISLCKAMISGSNERKFNGAQQNPDDDQLQKYAERYRLRVFGGIAALHKTSKDNDENEDRSDFVGRMYSFFPLADTTSLPFHLNGTWAQGSDRGRLLIEEDDMPDLDHQKLSWNRHILLDFLPKLYGNLIKKSAELNDYSNKIHPISKFWPFPSINRNYPKYAIEYGFKVLEDLFQNEEILFSGNESDRVKFLFELLSYKQIIELSSLLRNNWNDMGIKYDPNLKPLVRSLPIWSMLSNLSNSDSNRQLLKPASGAYILPESFHQYRIRTSSIFLDAKEKIVRRILTDLGVPTRTMYEYTFEDVEFPRNYDSDYLEFLKDILKDKQIVQNLKDKRCFPNSKTTNLKKITDLYDYNNLVFRAVFGGDSNIFLHFDLSQFVGNLARIGFNHSIDTEIFKSLAEKIDELQADLVPPSDIRYRGFTLVDHLYQRIDTFELNSIERIPFIPIVKNLGKPYNLQHNHSRVLGCMKDVILPAYREVAWSQKFLIADDVIPPQQVLDKYPSFGKPDVSTVVKHLRFLYKILLNDEDWKKDWRDAFKNNIYEVYKWLNEECRLNEDLDLTEYIRSEPLFLNFKINKDPFNLENWVYAYDLVLNSELGELKYVNLSLAEYPYMLKSAGVREIKRPNVRINVRQHDQSNITKNTLFEFLLDPTSSLNDVTFVTNGENIKASKFLLSASSKFFCQRFTSVGLGLFSSINISTFNVNDIQPNSIRILLRYLYGQNIDDAIQNQQNLNEYYHQDPNLTMYKDLLKLANDYMLDHLKELMELRISRLVFMSNVEEIKEFSENLSAKQLYEYCYVFIRDNSEL
ncbi:11810_t:CDS:2, partial [Funneliformis geosporum]